MLEKQGIDPSSLLYASDPPLNPGSMSPHEVSMLPLVLIGCTWVSGVARQLTAVSESSIQGFFLEKPPGQDLARRAWPHSMSGKCVPNSINHSTLLCILYFPEL